MKTVLLIVLVAALTAFATVKLTDGSGAGKESAYDRVVKSNTLRCGYVNWYPYFILDPNEPSKPPTGVNVEITEAVGKILGLKVVWAEEAGWGELAAGLESGRYDAVCTSAWPDSAKLKHLSVSDAMFYDVLYLYARSNDTRFVGSAGSINKPSVTIAAIEGGTSYETAQSAFPNAKIFAVSPNAPTGDYYATVAAKKADILITSPSEFAAYDEANPGKLARIPGAKPVRFMPMTMLFGPNEDRLRDRVNYALQIMVDNADMDRIVAKYSREYVLRQAAYE